MRGTLRSGPEAFSRWGVTEATTNDLSAQFAAIATELRTTVDGARFWELAEEAEDILADQLPLIPLFVRQVFVATARGRVEGVVPNGTVSHNTWNVETWMVPSE